MQFQKGFTLIELMIVIVMVAIVFSIGVPSFSVVIKRNNVDSLQMKLASAVSSARSQAASRNTTVSMCSSSTTTACGGSWSDGWVTFEDRNADGVLDLGEIVIDVYEHDSDYTFSATNSAGNSVSRMTFSSQGYMQGTESTLFTICEPDGKVDYAKGVYVSGSGLMIKTRDNEDADTIHDNPFKAADANPADLTCS